MGINKVSNQELSTLGANAKLLLHYDGSDGATTTTDGTGRHSTINFVGGAELDTSDKKWGTASLYLNGVPQSSMNLPDSDDWDLIGSNSDNWNLDFWIKPVSTSGTKFLIGHWTDSSNYWTIRMGDGELDFYAESSGASIISTGWSGVIMDTSWQHILLAKVADKYGLYRNGTQVCYTQDSSTATYSGNLYIGRFPVLHIYVNARYDEIKLCQSNPFGASPNIGKTDTITVPTEAYKYKVNKISTTTLSDIAKVSGITV